MRVRQVHQVKEILVALEIPMATPQKCRAVVVEQALLGQTEMQIA
jgi:hypothetical protein